VARGAGGSTVVCNPWAGPEGRVVKMSPKSKMSISLTCTGGGVGGGVYERKIRRKKRRAMEGRECTVLAVGAVLLTSDDCMCEGREGAAEGMECVLLEVTTEEVRER
jgi:hypothetical protein